MGAKHTQGPWFWKQARSLQHLTSEKHGGIGITIVKTKYSMDAPHVEANTRLIAAAPELLEALEIAEEVLRKGVPTLTTIECVTHLQAIIARAKGN